nr:glycoside hydrolase family 97 N-terminal domain-containing protein [Flavobacterium anhuiense]
MCLVSFLKLNAQSVVKSPDGKLAVSVSADKGMPQYSVTYNEKTFIEKSPLGLKTNAGDFSSGLALEANGVQNKIDESYQLRNIKKAACITRPAKLFFRSQKRADRLLMLFLG